MWSSNRRPVQAPSALDPDLSPKSIFTLRTAGASGGGDTFTVNVTRWSTSGSAVGGVTVTRIAGSTRTTTAIDDRWRRPAASRTVAVTT